jgi:hypothetical protein
MIVIMLEIARQYRATHLIISPGPTCGDPEALHDYSDHLGHTLFGDTRRCPGNIDMAKQFISVMV